MKLNLGIIGGLACIAMPFLCRIPRGSEWVGQYVPSGEPGLKEIVLFLVIIGSLSSLPAFVVFYAAKVSQRPLYLPFVFSLAVALSLLWYWHHANDLSIDAQAPVSLVFIPIYTAMFALIAAVLGQGIQKLISTI